jgi:hypothetical protein
MTLDDQHKDHHDGEYEIIEMQWKRSKKSVKRKKITCNVINGGATPSHKSAALEWKGRLWLLSTN